MAASSINPRHERGKCGGRWNSVRTACEHGLFTWLPSCGCRDWCKSKSLPIFSAPLCVSYDDAYVHALSLPSSTNTFFRQHLRFQPNFKRTYIVERIVARIVRTSHFFLPFFHLCVYFLLNVPLESQGFFPFHLSPPPLSFSFSLFFFFFPGKDYSRSNSTRGHLKKLAGVSLKKPGTAALERS